MRPAANTTTAINIWKSPIPYLFGSLGLVLMLIASALVLLACSYRKRHSNSSVIDEGLAPEKSTSMVLKPLDNEPRIVVLMPGDEKPTHLAMPAIPSHSCCCDDQV